MTEYVRLRSEDPVLIEEGPSALPHAYAGISGFHRLTAKEIKEHGWLEYSVDDLPEFDADTQETESILVLEDDKVRLTHEVKPLHPAVVARLLEEAKQEAIATVASLRWEAEVSGTEWEGIALDTSREGRTALFQAAQEGEEEEWKDRYGYWNVMSPEQLQDAYRAVQEHKRRCFAMERQLTDEIQNMASIKGLRKLDLETPWRRLV